MKLYTIGFTHKRLETFSSSPGAPAWLISALTDRAAGWFARKDDLPYFLDRLAAG
jgi:hypothetical protein